MINITLGVVLGSPNMKYPKNWFKIINITQIPEMNPTRGFCFIVHCFNQAILSYLLLTCWILWQLTNAQNGLEIGWCLFFLRKMFYLICQSTKQVMLFRPWNIEKSFLIITQLTAASSKHLFLTTNLIFMN